jgi:hypothetical protein
MPDRLLGRSQLHHVDTVNWAGLNTQITTRTLLFQDGVHYFSSAQNCVHRTGLYALGAADALGFPDYGDAWGLMFANRRIQRLRQFIQEPGKLDNGCGSAGRAAID